MSHHCKMDGTIVFDDGDVIPPDPDAEKRRVVRTATGGVIVVERDGDEVAMLVYPQGLDQYVGEAVTLSWRKAGALAVALLDTADGVTGTGGGAAAGTSSPQ